MGPYSAQTRLCEVSHSGEAVDRFGLATVQVPPLKVILGPMEGQAFWHFELPGSAGYWPQRSPGET